MIDQIEILGYEERIAGNILWLSSFLKGGRVDKVVD